MLPLPQCEAKWLSGWSKSRAHQHHMGMQPLPVGFPEWLCVWGVGGREGGKGRLKISWKNVAGRHWVYFIKLKLTPHKWGKCLVLERKIDLNQKSREGIQDPVTFAYEFMLLRKHVHSDPSEDTSTGNTQYQTSDLPPSAPHPGMW